MPTQTKFIIFIVLVVIIIGGAGAYFSFKPEGPGKLDDFAQCLSSSGAKFYGAFWCSHCQDQKKDFGSSKKYLPYVECSTPDGQDQLPVCKDAGVKGFPTWIFANGEKISGRLSLETLAEKTMCVLPQ
jgi:hypothetical protein